MLHPASGPISMRPLGLTEQHYEKLAVLAQAFGLSRSAMVRLLIDQAWCADQAKPR